MFFSNLGYLLQKNTPFSCKIFETGGLGLDFGFGLLIKAPFLAGGFVKFCAMRKARTGKEINAEDAKEKLQRSQREARARGLLRPGVGESGW